MRSFLFLIFVFGGVSLRADIVSQREMIWNKITASQYKTLPKAAPGNFRRLLCMRFLAESFNVASDELPLDRQGVKPIHTYGSVAKVRFVPVPNNYTGIFQSGGVGLARLSQATLSSPPFIPGLAVKFYIEGQASANLHVMHSVDGQGENHNPFKEIFTNILPKPKTLTTKVGSLVFRLSRYWMDGYIKGEGHLPLNHLSEYDSSGAKIESPIAPEKILFVPTREVQLSEQSGIDMREKLSIFKPGTRLYDVVVQDKAGAQQYVGFLEMESEFVASLYGDQVLFFQHGTIKR